MKSDVLEFWSRLRLLLPPPLLRPRLLQMYLHSAATPSRPAPPPRAAALTQDEVVPVKGIQRMMAASMTQSLSIPHFNLMDEFELTEMAELRKNEACCRSARARRIQLCR